MSFTVYMSVSRRLFIVPVGGCSPKDRFVVRVRLARQLKFVLREIRDCAKVCAIQYCCLPGSRGVSDMDAVMMPICSTKKAYSAVRDPGKQQYLCCDSRQSYDYRGE
jgi:hypothetical protein